MKIPESRIPTDAHTCPNICTYMYQTIAQMEERGQHSIQRFDLNQLEQARHRVHQLANNLERFLVVVGHYQW